MRAPDLAIVDIRMPPTLTDEGLVAPRRIRSEHPGVGVLVLSQYVEPSYALRLLEEHPGESVTYSRTGSSMSRSRRRLATNCGRRETVVDPSIVLVWLGDTAATGPPGQAHPTRARGDLGIDCPGTIERRDLPVASFITERTVQAHTPANFPEAPTRARTLTRTDG